MMNSKDAEQSLSYTLNAWKNINDTVETEDFASMDADMIFSVLLRSIRDIPFREYLKRYLYRRTELLQPFSSVSVNEYQDIIVSAFRESATPCSFGAQTTRLPQTVRNWLTRDDVSRDSVLLMGFGLYMSEEDVSAFLTKALHESLPDADDAREAICLYCYRHGYRFAKYRQLMDLYGRMDGEADLRLIAETQPSGRAQSQIVIREDAELLSHLLDVDRRGGPTRRRRRTAETFTELYGKTESCLRDPAVCSFDGPRSLERVLNAGVPLGSHGNLVPERAALSSLGFARRRISRQRIHRLLNGVQAPNRYDLLTLYFFLTCCRTQDAENRRAVLDGFISGADEMLAECGFGGIYAADPFDAFLVLCVLSCDPMGTYSDVMEAAYTKETPAETENDP